MDSRSQHDQFITTLAAHERIIFKICNAYCKQEADKQDLAQEIIIQLWRSFHRYDGRHKFSTWLYRIALNVAISFVKRNKKRHGNTLSIEEQLIDISNEELDELDEQIKLLHQFIDELDEMNKALMLLYLDDHSHQEIGEILGISTSNVGTKVGRIKRKLAKRFEAYGIGELTPNLSLSKRGE